MVQGKFKKANLPANIQKKQKQKNSVAFTRRSSKLLVLMRIRLFNFVLCCFRRTHPGQEI